MSQPSYQEKNQQVSSIHTNKSRKAQNNKDLEDVKTERLERDHIKIQKTQKSIVEDIPKEAIEVENEPKSVLKETLQDVQKEDHSSDLNKEESKDQEQSIGQINTLAKEETKSESPKITEQIMATVEVRNQLPQVAEQKKLLFWVYGGNYPETVVEGLLRRGNWQQGREEDNIEKCNFLWKPFNYAQDGYKRIDKRLVRNNQAFVYNHFEQLKGMVTKSGLIRSLKQYYFNNDVARQAGYSIFDTTATTFLLASGVDDSEQQEFIQRYKDITRGYAPKERIPLKHCMNNIWLVKPSNANQGRGIEIFSDMEELLFFVNTRPQYTCCVVQKYIERPMLFKQRKFDIRVWALVTCKNEVFFYKKGYLRTSSDDYSLSNGNNYVHLTNNCLQKFGDNYGIHEEGNTIGFEAFQQYLDENFAQYGLKVEEHFIARMKDIIIDSFLAVKHQLNPNRRKNCFELFGYDFLIDEDFRLWLIEINTNPYFGVPNNYIANLLPKMMDDLLDIVVDPIYPPDVKPTNCSTPNEFEIIYCESASVYSPGPLNKRRPFSTSLYPVPELAQFVGPKAPKQDIKYLKTFKVQGGNLSTLNYKNKKNQSSTNLQEQVQQPKKHSLRSKSMINSKYAQNQATQNKEQNTRSKSIAKNIGLKPHNDSISSSQIINNSILNTTSKRNPQKMNLTTQNSSDYKQEQLSKTPKNTSFKYRNPQILTTVIQANKTERQTPNNKVGMNILHQIAERTHSVKRDLSNNNTTKESTSQGINSHTSSQDQLLFQVKESQSQDLTSSGFESQFNKLMDKIRGDATDLSKISTNLEVIFTNLQFILLQQLGMMMRQERIGQLAKENYIYDLVNISMHQENIPYQISSFIIDMLYKLSMKFQVCQMMLKTKIILQILSKYQKSQEDEAIKCNLLKILINISCIKDIKQIQTSKNAQLSPRINGGVTGVQVLKEQQYKRSLDKGIMLIILENMSKYKQLIGDLSQVISIPELHQIIGQLESKLRSKVKEQAAFNKIEEIESHEDRIKLDLRTDLKQMHRLNTDPEISPSQDSERLIKSNKNKEHHHKKQDSLNSMSVIKFNLSFDARKNIVSRSERLQDKEKRSDQQSSNITPKPEIVNINQAQNQEILDMVFQCVDIKQSLDQSKELFNKVQNGHRLIQESSALNKHKISVVEQAPTLRQLPKTVQQSITSSPLKKSPEQKNRKDSGSPLRKSLQEPNHQLILKDSMFIQSPSKNVTVHSTKQGAILNAQYYTPEKQKQSFQLDQKEVPPYQNNDEGYQKKSSTILSAFLSKNASISQQQQLNCSSSLNQMNINHLNSSSNSKFYKNVSYQQETSSSNQKKQLSSKYIPILKDKKYVHAQILPQQQISTYSKIQPQKYADVDPYSPQNDKKKKTLFKQHIGSSQKYHDSKSHSRISSRASSKQILHNRDSLITDYQRQMIESHSKKRLSELAKPYCDSHLQKKSKTNQNSTQKRNNNNLKSETKRPPRHSNTYFQNSMSQQNKDEYTSNLRTYESVDDNSLSMVPTKDFEDTYEAFGTSEGVPNKTILLDMNYKLHDHKVSTTGRANNGPSIPTNFFYPKNNGDVSIKSNNSSSQKNEFDSANQPRRMSQYSSSQQQMNAQLDKQRGIGNSIMNAQIAHINSSISSTSNVNRGSVVVTGDDRHLFRKKSVNQKGNVLEQKTGQQTLTNKFR